MPDLSVKFAKNFEVKNPVITASGCCSYGLELCDYLDIADLGGISVKGISRNPHVGNPPNRICETPAGMLNAIGLQNIGAENFANNVLPQLKEKGATVIANVWGNEPDDFVAVVERLTEEDGIAAFELNISCPNISAEFTEFGINPKLTENLVTRVRAATNKHLMVKLSPNASNIAAIGMVAQDCGADSVSAINTILGLEIDMETKRPTLFKKTGGLSGPAIRPIGLRCVWQLYKKLSIPIIGMGGITTVDDILKYYYVGASAVQVGTSLFVDPSSAAKLVTDLEERLERDGIKDLSEIIGIAHQE